MTYRVYFPWIQQGSAGVETQGEALPCGMTAVEYELYNLVVDDPAQERGDLVCDERLVRAAQDKAAALQQQGSLSHTIDGVSANRNVEDHGYDLPDWYNGGPDANNVESIAGGYRTPSDALEGWRGSEPHRQHVFGEGNFYGGQSRIGVGHVYVPDDSKRWRDWWVVIIAHKE